MITKTCMYTKIHSANKPYICNIKQNMYNRANYNVSLYLGLIKSETAKPKATLILSSL